jgi:hypothetical protein
MANDPDETISTEAFQALLDRVGLKPTPEEFEVLRETFPKFRRVILDRLPRSRAYTSEPALIFKAGKG